MAQDNDPDISVLKEWLHQGNTPNSEELKKLNTNLQRYAKIFESIKMDESTHILSIESAPNEHLEIDKFRILLPKALTTTVIRRFHKSPQESHLTM